MAATVATFAYDALDDAAISVFVPITYARFILHREGESLLVRLLLAVALGLLAAWRFSFDRAGWADAAGLLLLHCITIARLDRIIARASNLPRPTLLQCGALGAAVLVGPWLARHLLPIDELAELRRNAPVWWCEQQIGKGGFNDGGYWVIATTKFWHVPFPVSKPCTESEM